MYRHGDVWLERCDAVPVDAVKVAPGVTGYVLAEGEATGHAHTVEAAPDVELYERDGTLYLRVLGASATVKHQEHAASVLPRGTYVVERQRVWDSASAARTVAD
jgi:hypothetical protein